LLPGDELQHHELVVLPRLRSGGDFLVEAEVFFDCGDADFELLAFVDFVLLELGQLGVETVDVVFGRHVLDDETEHIAEFFERHFLGHAFEVMSL
jgi:hypothetical protein